MTRLNVLLLVGLIFSAIYLVRVSHESRRLFADLDKARNFLVTLARASGRKETGMLDTHPAGPERLAAWDKAVAEIRASGGALPKRN